MNNERYGSRARTGPEIAVSDGTPASRVQLPAVKPDIERLMRIAIADDHNLVRQGLAQMLSDEEDVEIVGQAHDGASLIGLLRDTPVDIVLLDIRMPGMDGLSALRQINTEMPQVRVIMLSMHDEPAYVRSAVELGARGYLLKRTTREELTRALRAVADGNAYIQGEIVTPLVKSLGSPSRRHASPGPARSKHQH